MLASGPATRIPVRARNGGIEALVYNFGKKLAEHAEVTLAAPKYSYIPGVKEVIETVNLQNPLEAQREDLAYKRYHKRLKEFDAIHDFSHKGIAGRIRQGLPQVKMLWHGYGNYPEPRYNLMALSQWHAGAMKEIYKQEVRYLHMGVDTDFYAPKPDQEIGDYFCYIGHAVPTKGMVEAINYARKAQVKLHITGQSLPPEQAQWRERAVNLCDGKQIVWRGEVSNEAKRDELRAARGFLFPVQQDEGSSLAIMEALSCGVPVITANRAAYPELVTKDVGVCCRTEEEYLNVIANKAAVESFDRKKVRQRALDCFSLEVMVQNYLRLYGELQAGTVWH